MWAFFMNEYLFSDIFTCKSCLHYDWLRIKDSTLLLLLKSQILKTYFNESHIFHVDHFVNSLSLLMLTSQCNKYTHLHKSKYKYISHFSFKHQSSDLNTLSLSFVDWTSWVYKRCVQHSLFLLTVKTLQQNSLIIFDAWSVISSLIHVRY